MGRVLRALLGAGQAASELLVDDGAVAVGILLAVAAAAVLSALVGGSDAVGWVLFGLLWAALAVSLYRSGVRRRLRR